MKASNIIMGSISALPLSPGDVLVVHCEKLNAEQRRELEFDLTKKLWGKQNTFMLLTGDIRVGKTTPAKDPSYGNS